MANYCNANEYSTGAMVEEEKKSRGGKRKRTTRMNIRADRAEDVRRLLERLEMQDNQVVEEKASQLNNEEQYEVTSVCGHRQNKDGSFSWRVRFKGYPAKPEWVDDLDCHCEAKIQAYLADHAPFIRTVYGLCRVSSKNQTGPTHVSLAAQEHLIRRTAKSLDLAQDEVMRVKIYSISASAYQGIPKQLKYIAEVARPRDILITYRVDRLSRNIVRFLGMLEDINEKGVLIYAQDENLWYHNAKLDFLQCILDANKEAAVISKRVRLSVEHRRRRGDYIGSAPFGYRLARDPKTRAVTKNVNPEEQQVIARIKKSRIRDDHSLAETLNKEGIKKRGRTWTPAMVKYVRKNN